MNERIRRTLYLIIALFIIVMFYQYYLPGTPPPKDVTISDITTLVSNQEIDKITIDGNTVTAQKKDGSSVKSFKESDAKLSDYGITPDKVPITVVDPDKGTLLPMLISVILPFGLILIVIYIMFRSAQGANMRAMSFGKSSARLYEGKKKTTFADVAGNDEAKQELIEVVEFLRYPEKFKRLGAEIPKGVLLVGPPGTGKTLMARAVAGEAGVPFFSISASEFVEMFVGVGAARVRDLFSKAKKNAPAILFIDEMDAIGRHRGTGLGGSHDEREQTLNQILVEMDGFETETRVIVMAATNRPDVLDPALLRPGRFDRRVVLDLPDKKARHAILGIHITGKPVQKTDDMERIAQTTAGFSGADLKNAVNEAAIFAARADRKEIIADDFNQAIEKVMLGPERKSKIMSQYEKEVTAYHESGHALIAAVLKHTDTVHKISIISRGMALGYTWTRPEEDKHLHTKEKFEDEIAQLLGGRVAEKMIFNQLSTGASNDLQRATKLAHDMVTRYGMSDKIGPITFGDQEEAVFLGKNFNDRKVYSDKIANVIDDEVEHIIRGQEKRATALLTKHKAKLKKLALRLLQVETIEQDEFEKLIA